MIKGEKEKKMYLRVVTFNRNRKLSFNLKDKLWKEKKGKKNGKLYAIVINRVYIQIKI